MGTATLVRMAAADMMPDIDRVLFLDVDLVVLADIGELASLDLAGNPLAAATDLSLYGWHHDQRRRPSKRKLYNMDKHLRERIGLGPTDWYDYVNTGIAVMDLAAMRREGFTARALDYLDGNADKLPFPDQDAFNVLLKGRISLLDPSWNAMSEGLNRRSLEGMPPNIADAIRRTRQVQKIIHFAGNLKPWKRSRLFRGAGDWWHFANRSPTSAAIRADYRAQLRQSRRLPDPRLWLDTALAARRYGGSRRSPLETRTTAPI
jgi:lipopolysaccharide biosynthesis glycosyltransferase